MGKIRVAAVSYLNSIPFIYGLEKSGLLSEEIDLSLDIPSVCSDKILSNQVDLGLIPIATIPSLKKSKIIGDYCIGSNGPVETVCLFSNVSLNKIKNIILDFHSRTSVQLLHVLSKYFWKINPSFIPGKKGFEKLIFKDTAALIIGDRSYQYRHKYKYVYDLSEEWFNHTKLPFVFACWVANKGLSIDFERRFLLALKLGLQNINAAINERGGNYLTQINKLLNFTSKCIMELII